MAELVELRMQEMVPEIESMERLNLLTKNEIKKLIEKRRDMEYKLIRRKKQKHCFVSYVLYESKILELLNLRRRKMYMFDRFNEIDKAITLRVVARLRMMTRMWFSHLDVWQLRISFAKARNLCNEVSSTYAEQIKFHGDNANVWVSWAQWEMQGRDNFHNARTLLLSRATIYHPNSLIINREHFRLELLYVESLKSKKKKSNIEGMEEIIAENRDKVLDCGVAEIIYRTCQSRFETPDLYVEFFFVAKKFPFAHKLALQILCDLLEKYRNDAKVWSFRSKLIFEGYDDTKLESPSLLREKLTSSCDLGAVLSSDQSWTPKDKVEKLISLSDRAMDSLGCCEFLDTYLADLFKLLYEVWPEEEFATLVKSKILDLLSSNKSNLKPIHFLIWLHVATCMEINSADIKDISKEAFRACPKDQQIKLKHLTTSFPSLSPADKTCLIEDARGEVGAELCLELANRSRQKDAAKYADRAAAHFDRTLCAAFRAKYVNTFSELKQCRLFYDKYATVPPFDVKLHAFMLLREVAEAEDKCLDRITTTFRHAVKQFGSTEVGLWLCFIEFAKSRGELRTASLLVEEASSSLEASPLADFLDLRINIAAQRESESSVDVWSEALVDGRTLVEDGPGADSSDRFEAVWKGSNLPPLFEVDLPASFSAAEARSSFFRVMLEIREKSQEKVNLKDKEDCTELWERLFNSISGTSVSFSVRKMDLGQIGPLKEAETFCSKSDKEFKNSQKKMNEELSDALVAETPSGSAPREKADLEAVLRASDVLDPEFLKKTSLSPYFKGKHTLRREKQREREKSAGEGWFGMKAPEKTEEVIRDLGVLQMRSVLDPKRHYKRSTMKAAPKFFQMGKVLDSASEFYSSRVPKSARKRTIAEEIMNDQKVMQYQKKKYKDIVQKKKAKLEKIIKVKQAAKFKKKTKTKNIK